MAKRRSSGSLKNAWNRARETTKNEAGSFGDAVPVEPGKYMMQLVGEKIGEFGNGRKVMLTFCVVGDSDDAGTLCKLWEGPIDDPERLVWLQRLLKRLGVEDSALEEIESEDDLETVLNELIEDYTVVSVKVTEKDGYTNMRVEKTVDIDEDDLVEPAEALEDGGDPGAGGGSKGGGKSKPRDDEEDEEDEEGDDDAPEFEEGDSVSFERNGKEGEGEVVEVLDDGETLKVKPEKGRAFKIAADECELLEGDDEEGEGDDEEEDEGEGEESEYEYNEDDRVLVEYEGDELEATVTGAGTDAVTVLYDVDETEEVVKADRIIRRLDDEEEDEGEGEDDDEGEIAVGDEVIVEHKGKDKAGKVTKVDGDDVHVKIPGVTKPIVVPADEVAFDTD